MSCPCHGRSRLNIPLEIAAYERKQRIGAGLVQRLQCANTPSNGRLKAIEKRLEVDLGVSGTGDEDCSCGIQRPHDAPIELRVVRRIAARFPTSGAVMQTL